jgi:hypothetical protein
VKGEMDELPHEFREWSIYAVILECMAVILAFLLMVFFLKWKIDQTLLYILILIMVVSAVILIRTGQPAQQKK